MPPASANLGRAIVSVRRQADYDPAAVLATVRECLAPLGGMQAFVKPGQRVLLKPNLLGAFPVERAITTHPAVVRAVILLVQEAGGKTYVGDSPGMTDLPTAIRACGLEPVLRETGTESVDLTDAEDFEVPGFKVSPRVKLAKALTDFDILISVPKLKTHSQMTHTGALKNQFGLVPGTLKGQWHFRLQEAEWLASLILDINRATRPALAIMDAVVAMEGKGPAAGNPRQVGALLASADLAALDTISCELIGLEPRRVPLLAAAREQGFGVTDLERIEVVGESWRELKVPDFAQVEQLTQTLRLVALPTPILKRIRQYWTYRPRIDGERCTKCGICEEGCPVKPAAIHPNARRKAQVEDERCIRCYCCHEFCPSHAIDLQKPWLVRHIPLDALAHQAERAIGIAARIRNTLKR